MQLIDKFDRYLALFKQKQDDSGFILTDKCDSLLFSCLAGCVQGVDIKVDVARIDEGTWLRRPMFYLECYECGDSKSTISRDQLLGLAWYAWCNKRLDISEGIIKHALKNFGIMGKGVLSRTFIGGGLLSTFAWISYRLGGPSRPWLRFISVGISSTRGIIDFQAHLQVLHYHLRSEITGHQRDRGRSQEIALEHAKRTDNKNSYFNCVAGLLDRNETLLDIALFPDDRLPQDADRFSGWLWERDPGFDWCGGLDPDKQHTGGDFLWTAAWYLGKIKK